MIVAARTRLSGIDGEKGKLWLAGFSLEELAPNAHFEETAYLLWHGQLPDCEQLEAFPRSTVELVSCLGTLNP